MSTTTTTPAASRRQPVLAGAARRVLGTPIAQTLLALFLLCAFLTAFRPDTFFTLANLFNIFRQASINGIMVVGLTFVLVSGGIDLSVGSVAGFTALAVALLLKAQVPVGVALTAGAALGVVVGGLAGLLITRMAIPPFIATLAMLTILRGTIMVLSQGQPVTGLGATFGFIGTGYLGPFPFPVLLMLLCVLAAAYILKHTRFGRHVYAIGGNAEAARLSGIRTGRTIVACYMLSGLFATVSGMIMASRVNSATPLAGDGAELDAIAAAVIGGISLSGGKGFVVGGLVGALIIAVLNNGLILMDVSVFYTKVVKGAVILLAVAVDSLGRFKER